MAMECFILIRCSGAREHRGGPSQASPHSLGHVSMHGRWGAMAYGCSLSAATNMSRSVRLVALVAALRRGAVAKSGPGVAQQNYAVLSRHWPALAPSHVSCRGLFGSSSSKPDAESRRSAEKMIDLMATSPQMQQLIMASLPETHRNMETVQALLKDPGMKEKLVEMLAKQVLHVGRCMQSCAWWCACQLFAL